MISIRTRNIENIVQKLNEVPHGARGAATESAAKVLIGNERTGLQHYPNARAGSLYKRTYTLRFGWKATEWGDGTSIRVTNDVPYAPYVQGDTTQAWMHQGRWNTISDIIASNTTAMMKAIDEAINRFLKSKNLTK